MLRRISKREKEILEAEEEEELEKKVAESKEHLKIEEEEEESIQEKRFKIEKEKSKMNVLDKRRKKLKFKKVSLMAKKQSKGSKIEKRLKYVDLIIGLLILANFAMSLYENHHYTTKLEKRICEDNITNSADPKTIQTLRYLDIDTPEKPKEMQKCKDEKIILIKDSYVSDPHTNVMRVVIIAIIGLNEILLFFRYLTKLKLLQERYLACDSDNIFSTGLWWKFIIEFIILGICIPPYVDGTIKGNMIEGTFTYSYDSLINLFQIFKLYYFIRIYGNFSIWTSEKIKRIGLEYNYHIGGRFAIKAQLVRSPLISILIILSVSVGIFTFMFRIFEYGYIGLADDKIIKAIEKPDYENYADSVWVIIITMMTVGYGDIYPETHLGRMVAFLSTLIGMLIISLLVVTLSRVVEFTPDEKIAHNLILKSFAHEKLEKISFVFVKAVMRLYYIKNNPLYLMKCARKNNSEMISISTYVNQVLYIREIAVDFIKHHKVANTHIVPSDQKLNQLERRVELDTDVIGPYIFFLEDVNEMTSRIVENENQIKHALNILRKKQDGLINYLMKFNTIKSSVEIFEEESVEDTKSDKNEQIYT